MKTLTLFFVCLSFCTFSQSKENYTKLLLHYSIDELNEIKANDSIKFIKLNYYYNESYIITIIPCEDCVPFDVSKFDVSNYEKYRLQFERYTKTDHKFGFELMLLSTNELKYKLPIHLK